MNLAVKIILGIYLSIALFGFGLNRGILLEQKRCQDDIDKLASLQDDLDNKRSFVFGKHKIYPAKEPQNTWYYKKNRRKK